MKKAATISFITILLMCSASGIFFEQCSDSSVADTLPTIDVYKTDTGERLNGAILDHSTYECSSYSTPDGVKYILDGGLVLVSGKTYLKATGDGKMAFRLLGGLIENQAKPSNPYIGVTGLRILFFTNPACEGTPAFSAGMKMGETNVITTDMKNNTPYYIQVQIYQTGMFDTNPDLKNVGFTFTIDTGSDINAVYFDDGLGNIIDQKLMTNGDKYSFPAPPVRSGYIFTGWFTKNDERLTTEDVVELAGDITIFAHWWKGDTGDIQIITPSKDVVDIHTAIDIEKGIVLDIKATTPDGTVILEENGIDGGQSVIKLNFNGGTGDSCVLDTKRANDIVEVYMSLDEWLEEHEVDAIATVDVNPGNTATLEPPALEILSEKDITLTIIGNLLTLKMNSEMMSDLSDNLEDIVVNISAANVGELTDRQASAIRHHKAYSITIKSGDTEITNFKGSLLVIVPYTEPNVPYRLTIYCVADDGTLTNMWARYSDGEAVFTTTHLSVYVVDIQQKTSIIPVFGSISIAAMTAIAAIVAAYCGFIRKLEENDP